MLRTPDRAPRTAASGDRKSVPGWRSAGWDCSRRGMRGVPVDKYRLEEMSWKEAEEAFKRSDTAIVAVGTLHSHGPTPLGFDTTSTAWIADEVGKRTGLVTFPRSRTERTIRWLIIRAPLPSIATWSRRSTPTSAGAFTTTLSARSSSSTGTAATGNR